MPSNIIKIKPANTANGKFEEIDRNGVIVHQNIEPISENILETGNIVPCWSGDKILENVKAKATLDRIYDPWNKGKRPEFFSFISNRELDEKYFSVKLSKNVLDPSWDQSTSPQDSDEFIFMSGVQKHKIIIKIREHDRGTIYRSYEEDYKNMAQSSFWKQEESACFGGDGKDQPTGILKYNSAKPNIEIEVIETKASGKIDVDDITSLRFMLPDEIVQTSIFMMNPMCVELLLALVDKAGKPIYKPGPPATMFGIPVYTNQNMSFPIAGEITIIFGDFKNYLRITDIGEAIKEYKYQDPEKPGDTLITYIKSMGGGVIEAAAFKFLKIKE